VRATASTRTRRDDRRGSGRQPLGEPDDPTRAVAGSLDVDPRAQLLEQLDRQHVALAGIAPAVGDGHLDLAVANTGSVRTANPDGFGLRSAGERLRLLYQGRASLTLASEGPATVATPRLPMEPA